MLHGYFESIITDMGLIDAEHVELFKIQELPTEYGTVLGAGTGDLVGVQIPNQGEWLVDLKTMTSNEFEAGARDFTLQKWTAQVNCYGDWFGYDKMMVLAIQKDYPHALREYKIERDEDLLSSIYNKWGYVESCLRNNIVPT
jgi:hypothetical protein